MSLEKILLLYCPFTSSELKIKLVYVRLSDTASAKVLQLWSLDLLMVQVDLAYNILLNIKALYSLDAFQ